MSKSYCKKKEHVLGAMKEFPPDFELEQLLEKLVFMDKIEKGLLQIQEGNTIPHDQVKGISKQW